MKINPIILIDECEVIATINGKESRSEIIDLILPGSFKKLSDHLAKSIVNMCKELKIKDYHFLRIKLQSHIQKRKI